MAGYGAWARTVQECSLESGTAVIERNDSNYGYVVDQIAEILLDRLSWDEEKIEASRAAAAALAHKAEWKYFFKQYRKAYEIALKNAKKRNKK